MKTMTRLFAAFVAVLLSTSIYASVGKWADTPAGLPYLIYEGNVETDPSFLLGNYRINLLTHASGEYQLISGQRVWGCFNADPARPGHGRNRASVTVNDKVTELVGFGSKRRNADKYDVMTGAGFTRYDYKLDDGLRCTRTISVMPSESVDDASACFLVSVTFRNTGDKAMRITYDEAFSPSYLPFHERHLAEKDRTFKYLPYTEVSFRYLTANFAPVPQTFIQYPASDSRYRHEIMPLPVFLYSKEAFLSISEGELKAQFTDFKLKSGDTKTYHIVIGFADDSPKETAEKMVSLAEKGNFGAFESKWKQKLPDLTSEKDRNLRREMYLNAHMLEASAMYDRAFNETFVPQGGEGVYQSGSNMSNAAHLMAALPSCHYNPDLAKASMRYVMRHADFDGRIYQGNTGYGFIPAGAVASDDLQLRLFYVVAEYLRITGDYGFLDEEIRMYGGEYITVMRLLERCFLYLRDEAAGSSEADSWVREAAMVSACMPDFITQMGLSGKASKEFVDALGAYLDPVKKLCLEADGLYCSERISDEVRICLLHVPSIPASRRRDIYDYLCDKGMSENFAGRTYLAQFAFLAGVSTFDRLDAGSMMKKLIKEGWTSGEMIGEPTSDSAGHSVYAHLWPLYCYFRQME